MPDMTDKQFNAILIAIIEYAKDVRNIEKVIEYVKKMLKQNETGSTLNK